MLGLLHYLHWMQTQLSLQVSSAAAVTMSTVTEYAVPDTPDIVFPRVKHCSKVGRHAYVIYSQAEFSNAKVCEVVERATVSGDWGKGGAGREEGQGMAAQSALQDRRQHLF